MSFLVYRWSLTLFFTVCVGVTIYQAVHYDHINVYFTKLSNLNLCATMISTLIGAVYASLFFFKKIENSNGMTKVLKFYWFLWTQCLVLSCILSVYYWFFIYKGEFDVANVLKHITNSIFLVIDLCVVKHPGRHYNFFYMLVVEIVYLLLTVVYQFAGGLDE